jgi:uncharacterized short protein YbdD (DUF466 family)
MRVARTDRVTEPRSARTPLLARALHVIRTIVGAPDYARYLAHQRVRHPDATPLSREEFARERERARYEGTGSRCC